jgi:hypothetical protein
VIRLRQPQLPHHTEGSHFGTTQNSALRALMPFLAAAVLYAILSGFLIAHDSRHRLVELLAMQYFVVLPAAIYSLRSARGVGGWEAIRTWPVAAVVFLVLCAAVLVGLYIDSGVTYPDESAYRFQARVFASGRLYAEALPGADMGIPVPRPIYFEHHIFRGTRWFVKYPPGWPAILAIGLRLHLAPLVNPFLGAALVVLTFFMARSFFDNRVALLSVLVLVLSPFFLANIVGSMSHASCAVFVALACYYCLVGLRDLSIRSFLAAFTLVGLASQIRPLTGITAGLALGGAALYWTRNRPRVFFGILVAGTLVAALAAASILAVNHYYSGKYLVSLYALSPPGDGTSEFASTPAALARNMVSQARWGIQDTVVYTVPFCFVLVLYALFRETGKRAVIVTATLPFVLAIILYSIESLGSGSVNGERYYFETFPWVCIAAARGFVLMADRWRLSPAVAAGMIWVVIGLQLFEQAVALPAVVRRSQVTREVRKQVAGGARVVFLKESDQSAFTPKHANWNDADWRHASHIYLVDPGPLTRQAWANRFGEVTWKVVGYDEQTGKASVEDGPASPSRPER